MKPILLKALLIVCVLTCMNPSVFADNGGIKYKIKIHGAKDGSVKKDIKESTETWKLRNSPPSTVGQLRYRMEKDLETIESILESNGYYDGEVAMSLDTDRKKVRAAFNVMQGEQYRLRSIDLQFTGEPDRVLDKIKPRVRRKQRVIATKVFEEEHRILDIVKQKGYPFPKLAKRTVVVDRENKVVDLTMIIDPGELAYFGKIEVEGLDTLPERYIRRQLPWNTGDKYNVKEVEDLQVKLLKTGQFGSARVNPQQPEGETNAIPISIRVSERDKRTIRLGVSYSDIGPGAKAYWEHRSFFGGGERLQTAVEWTPVKQEGSVTLTRLGFLDARQSLVLNLNATREATDAYNSKKIKGMAMVLRDLTSTIQTGLGVGGLYSQVEQFSEQENYAYAIFPVQAIYDTSNDALNPVKGMQLFARTSYYQDALGAQSFIKTQLEGRHYAMWWERYRLSSALRLTLGSIDGAAVDSIPADERFYAGGGGSIRGYEYQSVGPQVDGVPTGGDKLMEFSAELRLQPGPRLGYVAFIDGGGVYSEEVDGAGGPLHYGAGLGLRWFTAIGPLRVDFAYPLNPNNDQVERVQFYISLGQAF